MSYDLKKYAQLSPYADVIGDTSPAILLAIETIADGEVPAPRSEAHRVWISPTDDEVELVLTLAWGFVGLTEPSLRWRGAEFEAPNRGVFVFEGHPNGAQFAFGTVEEAAEYAAFLRQSTGEDIAYHRVHRGELGGLLKVSRRAA